MPSRTETKALIGRHISERPPYEIFRGGATSSISALYLLLIAAINTVVLWDIFQSPLLKLVDSSWHMYPIGVLFGLGFDIAARRGPFWAGLAALSSNFGVLGYIIIAFIIASWGVSTLVYRLRGSDVIGA